MEKRIWITFGMIFLVMSFALGSFGQTAGALEFGELGIGENKTLTYFLINVGEETVEFSIESPEGILVEPLGGEIPAKGQQELSVTVFAEEEGEFSGKITATALSEETGVVTFQVAVEKDYRYAVVEEDSSHNSVLWGGLAIFITFFSLLIYKIKGGEKKWKRGKSV